MEMGAAGFNIILHPESRKAAFALEKNLDMPYAELARLYDIERISRQYKLFAAALGCAIDDAEYYEQAETAILRFKKKYGGIKMAIGQFINAVPIELALAMLKLGIEVRAVFAPVGAEEIPFLREISELNPEMRIYSSLSPDMMNYEEDIHVDITIGADAALYYPEAAHVKWNDDKQPFGYMGLKRLLETIETEIGRI